MYYCLFIVETCCASAVTLSLTFAFSQVLTSCPTQQGPLPPSYDAYILCFHPYLCHLPLCLFTCLFWLCPRGSSCGTGHSARSISSHRLRRSSFLVCPSFPSFQLRGCQGMHQCYKPLLLKPAHPRQIEREEAFLESVRLIRGWRNDTETCCDNARENMIL